LSPPGDRATPLADATSAPSRKAEVRVKTARSYLKYALSALSSIVFAAGIGGG
jgi:hypothetical protein